METLISLIKSGFIWNNSWVFFGGGAADYSWISNAYYTAVREAIKKKKLEKSGQADRLG